MRRQKLPGMLLKRPIFNERVPNETVLWDLHSTNSYLAIIDESGDRIFKEKLPDDIRTIAEKLCLYSGSIEGVVVESTYNWYWLVDGLMAEGYALHLANL